jgi:hypothetical protein
VFLVKRCDVIDEKLGGWPDGERNSTGELDQAQKALHLGSIAFIRVFRRPPPPHCGDPDLLVSYEHRDDAFAVLQSTQRLPNYGP